MTNLTKTVAVTVGFLASTLALAVQANYVQDSQLSEYRANKGESLVWVSHEDSDGGKGDVGSSGDTAFGEQGSTRFRFKSSVQVNDYHATPGISQALNGLPANTDMEYSLYYCDKKGDNSASTLHFGVKEVMDGSPLMGATIAESRVHVRDLGNAPTGEVKDCFKQVSIDFNTGSNTTVEIFAQLETDPRNDADMSKDAEVRVDEFKVIAK